MNKYLSSELSYFDIADNCLLHLDGSVSAIFKIEGIDPLSMDTESLLSSKQSIQSIYNLIEDGLGMQVFFRCKDRYDKGLGLYDRYIESMETKKPFALALCRSSLDQLRQDKLFCSDIFICINAHKIKVQKKNVFDALEGNKTILKNLSKSVSSYLNNLFSKVERLNKQEILDLLYETINPDRWEINQSFNDSGQLPIGVESTLSNRLAFNAVFFERDYFYSDKSYGQSVSLYAKPKQSDPAMFYGLLAQLENPFDFHCSYKVVGKDQYKEIQNKNTYRGVLESFSDFSLFGSKRNFKMEAKFEENEEYLEELERNGEKSFQFHFSITHYAKNLNRLRDQTNQIIKAFRSFNGADAFVQEYEQQRGYFSSLPASRIHSNRPYEEITKNISNMAPLYEPYKGSSQPVVLFRNQFNGLISYDLFDSDLENFNKIVSGTSGSGKSFFVSHICRNYIAQDVRTLFIDVGGSYKRTIECFNGEYHSLDTNISINPLLPSSIVLDKDEISPWSIQSMIEILTSMMKDVNKTGNTHEENLLLSNCLIALYKEKKDPILNDLIDVMHASSSRLLKKKPFEAELLSSLIKKLNYWVSGPYKSIFNGQSTLSLKSKLLGIDLKGVPEEIRGHIFLILSSWIDFIVFQEKGKKIIVFDEAWELIENASNLIEGLYRKSRKNYASIISIAQSYSDFLKCPVADAVVGSSSCKYILKVGQNTQPIAESLALSSVDIHNILSLQKVSGYFSEVFVKHDDQKFIARIVPTPLEYWTSTTEPKDLKIQRDFEKKFPQFDRMTMLIELANQYPYGFATEKGGHNDILKIS